MEFGGFTLVVSITNAGSRSRSVVVGVASWLYFSTMKTVLRVFGRGVKLVEMSYSGC